MSEEFKLMHLLQHRCQEAALGLLIKPLLLSLNLLVGLPWAYGLFVALLFISLNTKSLDYFLRLLSAGLLTTNSELVVGKVFSWEADSATVTVTLTHHFHFPNPSRYREYIDESMLLFRTLHHLHADMHQLGQATEKPCSTAHDRFYIAASPRQNTYSSFWHYAPTVQQISYDSCCSEITALFVWCFLRKTSEKRPRDLWADRTLRITVRSCQMEMNSSWPAERKSRTKEVERWGS